MNMADDFDDLFRPEADELPADGTRPQGSGGIFVVEGETEINGEEFESRFGGPVVIAEMEFDETENPLAPTPLPPDPKGQAAAEADAFKRWPKIEAAHSLGPNLPLNAPPEAIAARKAQFARAIVHFKAVQAAETEAGHSTPNAD